MAYNLNSSYGMAQAGASPFTLGKTFYVVGSTFANLDSAGNLYTIDTDGVTRFFSGTGAVTNALAQCVADRGDIVMIDPSYTTVLSAAELLSAETKGVSIIPVGKTKGNGTFFATRATAALPQSTQSALFTITGRVRVTNIIGQVTTAIQNQANNTKLVANPTVGNDVDICAVTSTANAAVGTQLSITGTFATGLVVTPSGAFVSQAAPVVLMAGTLDLSCAASNTGSVKWIIEYQPIDAGALIIAA